MTVDSLGDVKHEVDDHDDDGDLISSTVNRLVDVGHEVAVPVSDIKSLPGNTFFFQF